MKEKMHWGYAIIRYCWFFGVRNGIILIIHTDYFSLLFPDSQNLIGICLNFKEDFRDVFCAGI